MHSMLLVVLALALVVPPLAEATWVTGTVAIGGGWVGVVLGLKLLAIKGALIAGLLSGGGGRRGGRRGKRSLENNDLESMSLEEVFLETSTHDADDCAKMLICQLNAKPAQELQSDEYVIASTFGAVPSLDVRAPSVEFDVAAHMGRIAGDEQCKIIYTRCKVSSEQIMDTIRSMAQAQKQ